MSQCHHAEILKELHVQRWPWNSVWITMNYCQLVGRKEQNSVTFYSEYTTFPVWKWIRNLFCKMSTTFFKLQLIPVSIWISMGTSPPMWSERDSGHSTRRDSARSGRIHDTHQWGIRRWHWQDTSQNKSNVVCMDWNKWDSICNRLDWNPLSERRHF